MSCRQCTILRGFFGLSGPLLVLAVIRPDLAQQVARSFPPADVLTYAVPLLGVGVFLYRYYQYRRAQNRQPSRG